MQAHDVRAIADALPEMEFRELSTFNQGGVGVFVVPRGHWDRQELKGRVVELYVTPGATEHSTAEDPRVG